MSRCATVVDGLVAGNSPFFSKNIAAADYSSGGTPGPSTVLTITAPAANASATYLILLRVGYAQASHTYDSTRVAAYLVTVSRVAGAAAAFGISSAVGPQIATVGSGRTFTFTLTAGSVTGTTGVCTCPVVFTTTPSTANDAIDADMTIWPLVGLGGITAA